MKKTHLSVRFPPPPPLLPRMRSSGFSSQTVGSIFQPVSPDKNSFSDSCSPCLPLGCVFCFARVYNLVIISDSICWKSTLQTLGMTQKSVCFSSQLNGCQAWQRISGPVIFLASREGVPWPSGTHHGCPCLLSGSPVSFFFPGSCACPLRGALIRSLFPVSATSSSRVFSPGRLAGILSGSPTSPSLPVSVPWNSF